MNIAIFGGSFNPVHKGHLAIAHFSYKALSLSKLIFVPAYHSPFKKTQHLASPLARKEMLQLALAQSPFEISDFALNRKGPSYAIETIKHLAQKYPHAKLYYLIGSDHLNQITKWKDFPKILQLAQFVVFKRHAKINKTKIKRYNMQLLNNPLLPYSSSNYRQGHMDQVIPEVQHYIAQNQLYLDSIMKHMLDQKRYLHSLSVAKFAAQIAHSMKLNPRRAYLAGALHDITKTWSVAKQRQYLTLKGINQTTLKNYQLHALTSMVWARDEYLVADPEILSAIAKHTSLALELSLLDKIIFAADKLAVGRSHQGIQQDRALILKNFAEGFAQVVKVVYQILQTIDHRKLSSQQEEVYQKWMKC